jgi:hypothetical protein
VSSAPARGPITTHLITRLETLDFPVGDNTHPEDDYGWQGEPNAAAATFIPWMTITPVNSQPQTITGSFADPSTEWRMNYNVFYAGVTRAQSEALGDRIRLALCTTPRGQVSGENGTWRIQKVGCNAIGSNTRVGGAFPDYFTQSDSFEVWITKE